MLFKRPALCHAISLTLCSLGAAHAQTGVAPLVPPSAGQVLRELQTPPLASPPAIALPPAQPIPDASPASQTKVLIKSINITGNQEIPTLKLSALVSSLLGTEQTLAQLNAAARQITAYYRAQGFAVARAILPAQDITSGAVTIAVIEGRVSTSRVTNTSRLSDAVAGNYLTTVKPGDVIRSAQIDRGILLLQDTPGVAASRATLQPGASVGTSELLIEVTAAAALAGNVTFDNYGSRYTGEYRLGANLALASPLGLGDQLALSALTAGAGLRFGRIAYQVPVGSDGLRIGAAYFGTRYQLSREFALLQAEGRANSASVFTAYPFIRSPASNLSASASYESKRLNDRINSTNTATDKKLGVTSLGLAGNAQDSLGGGAVNSFELNLVLGKLDIASASALAIDAASSQTNGRYTRIGYGLSRLQRITGSTQLLLSVSGQSTSKNLDSSEKFSLGGSNGIRAYPQGEASGDEGYKGTAELRHSYGQNWQATAFYDFGSVRLNKNPFGAATPNRRGLGGVGFGLNAAFDKVQVKAALAWRTRGGLPTSIPESAVKKPVLLVQAAVGF